MNAAGRRSGDLLEIALVNNMPDQALSATQAQFARLVRLGAGGREIRWRCYSLPGIARSDTARRYLERSHEDIEALYRRGADALIVTGCEPRAARLDEEPYWPELRTLVEWARVNTRSTIWSCLAAHAAVLSLSGIERRRQPKKVSGVYTFERTAAHWADPTEVARALVPHSRYNGLAREDLEREGYRVASYSEQVGVDVFWREEPSLFLFLQGHPEYDADTLLKEYRRDVLRFLASERDDFPDMPEGVFGLRTRENLAALQARILAGSEPDAKQALTTILSQEAPVASWAEDTARLYRDWLESVSERCEAWPKSA